jgi:hypothetical protein
MNFDELFSKLDNIDKMEEEVVKMVEQIEICPDCLTPLTLIEREAYLVCQSCGFSKHELVVKDDYDANYCPKSFYKRMTHFLNTIKCLESFDRNTIPLEVIEDLSNEDFDNIQELKDLIVQKKYNKYIKSVFKIYRIIKNDILIHIPDLVKQKLIGMFKLISGCYSNIKWKNRKNLLKYQFIIKKLLEIIGYTDPVKYLNIYKTDKKIVKCNRVWKEICGINNWEYIEEKYEYYLNRSIKCSSCKISYPADNIYFYSLNKKNSSLMKRCARCHINTTPLTPIDKMYMKKKLITKLNISLLKRRITIKEIETFQRKLFIYNIECHNGFIETYKEYVKSN